MLDITVTERPMRVLDFDVECRPLSWYGGDFVTKEITAIAAAWIKPSKRTRVSVWALGDRVPITVAGRAGEGFTRMTLSEMLEGFVELYDQADMVTGHFIRGFDLPVINGALFELGMPALSDKLSQDTKLDLVKRSGISNSQENLGAMLGLRHPKVGMDQAKWRAANRLTPEGIALTKKRVVGDVRQHIEMRAELLRRGSLRTPKMWVSAGTGVGGYHA